MTAASALDLIGNTPLVHLARLAPTGPRLLAKCEFMNPGGSLKDRAARAIVLSALADGRLRPGQPVVEMTSGNMGAGLAVVCAALGQPLVLTLSVGNSPERARMMRALGAEVVLVDQVDGTPGQVTGADVEAAERLAERIAGERGGFWVDQFRNEDGLRAHQQTTGPEIWRDTGGRIAAYVGIVGTGAAYVGTMRALRAQHPAILGCVVEPEGCAALAGKPVTRLRHPIQGTSYGYVPPKWELALADRFFEVSDEEVADMRQRLAREEGLHVGISAAANVAGALKLIAAEPALDGDVVTLLCDTGLKYGV